MLNTRSSLPVDPPRRDREDLTVLEYGIPDLSAFSAANRGPPQRVPAGLVRPRRGRLRAAPHRRSGLSRAGAGNELSLIGVIEAKVLTDMVPEPISFETTLGS